MKTVIIPFLLITICSSALAQVDNSITMNNIFIPKPPKDSVNILYYHFYDGIQMVELDFKSPYNQNVAYRDQAFARAIPHSMIIPPPHPNVYLFRDTLGRIVKSYNLYGLKTDKFILRSPKRLSESNMVFHGGNNILRTAEIRRYYSIFYEHISSKPFDVYIFAEGGAMEPEQMYDGAMGASLKGAKYGLIDTTGAIIISAKYDYISDFESKITTVALAGKQGLINNKGVELLPCTYDNISIQEDVAIAYLKKTLILYNTEGKKINVNNYEGEINFYDGTSRVNITGKGYGIINANGHEICPLEYDFIEELPQEHLDGKRYYYARKSGKEFYISQTGKVTEK